VVISIISLLIALLLPALGSARESAVSITCTNQIKQNHLAVAAYAADFRDWIVPDQFNGTANVAALPLFDLGTAKWGQILLWQRYATDNGGRDFTNRALKSGQFMCPSCESSGSYHGTYGLNSAITASVNYQANGSPKIALDWYATESTDAPPLNEDGWKRIGDLAAPSQTYMIGDSARQTNDSSYGQGEYQLRGKGDNPAPMMRHINDTVWNVAFCDGHVATSDTYVADSNQPARAIEWRGRY